MEKIDHRKVRNNFFVLIIILFGFGMIYRCCITSYEENQLKNTQRIYGNTIKYSSIVGANYIYYEYAVNDNIYQGSVQIPRVKVDTGLINKNNILIEYSIDDPSISRLVDPRFE